MSLVEVAVKWFCKNVIRILEIEKIKKLDKHFFLNCKKFIFSKIFSLFSPFNGIKKRNKKIILLSFNVF